MKILVVCQHYYPEDFKVTDMCEHLQNSGHQVTALVGLPNYPLGYVPDDYKHHQHDDEFINGVHVIRCLEIGRRQSKIFLALNYFSFWFSSILKVHKLDKDFDVVIGYESSPVTMVAAAGKYAKKYHVPYYLWCYDIWPECLKVYIKSESNLIFKVFKKISYSIYNKADKILCTSSSFIDYMKRAHGFNDEKLEYLPQFGDDTYLQQDYSATDNGIIDFVFMGNIGQAQNLEKVFDACVINSDLNFKLHIVGDGSNLDNLKRYAKEVEIEDKIVFYGRQPYEKMGEFYKLADCCVVSLTSENEIGYTLPLKVTNYLAAGKCVMGMISGSAKTVIQEANCGFCVNGDDVEGFTSNMREFIVNNDKYKELGENGREYYRNHFTKDIIFGRLEQYINK